MQTFDLFCKFRLRVWIWGMREHGQMGNKIKFKPILMLISFGWALNKVKFKRIWMRNFIFQRKRKNKLKEENRIKNKIRCNKKEVLNLYWKATIIIIKGYVLFYFILILFISIQNFCFLLLLRSRWKVYHIVKKQIFSVICHF